MIEFFQASVIALLLIIIPIVFRIIKGPTVFDRLVGVNIIGTKTIVILVLLGVLFERLDMFVDLAIAYGLLNFIASIAIAKFFQHHRVMSPELQWKGESKQS